jgi:hypothetical protein
MANETIFARKGKLKKRFNVDAWALLKNKNGWEEIGEEPAIVADEQKKPAPPSGQKTVEVIGNNSVVENKINSKKSESDQVVADEQKKQFTISAEFLAFAKQNLTKSILKDYFDRSEVNVPYKNNMSLDELISLLAEKLFNDIDSAKTIFKIIDTNSSEL